MPPRSPLDVEFDDTFGLPNRYDVVPRLRKFINPVIAVANAAKFTVFVPRKPKTTTPSGIESTPPKRKRSDCEESNREYLKCFQSGLPPCAAIWTNF
jgi:hypothetical protein